MVLLIKRIIIFFLLVVFCSCASKPHSHPGSPRSYKVNGQWYQPISNVSGFSQKGRASWYGKKFHGRKTANGEIYNMYALTAAHKTLPFNTWLRVENRDTGKTVNVRVNDRGPFVKGRIIDLSYKAAGIIGMAKTGTARVRLSVISSPSLSRANKLSSKNTHAVFSVQVGSFSDKSNAVAFKRFLSERYENVRLFNENGVHKVRVGRFSNRKAADNAKKALTNDGYSTFIVQE